VDVKMRNSISLEFVNESHAIDLAKITCNDAISKTSGVPPQCDEATVREWVQKNSSEPRTQITFVIIIDSKVAGCCVLKRLNIAERTAELSYWLGVDYWGKGITHEAAALLCDFAFDVFNLTSITAHFLKSNNAASGRILTKLGFVPDADKSDLPVADRFAHLAPDVWTFVILTRDKWLSSQQSTGWSIVSKNSNNST